MLNALGLRVPDIKMNFTSQIIIWLFAGYSLRNHDLICNIITENVI